MHTIYHNFKVFKDVNKTLSTTTRGVRKVSENILSDGRAIIVTEKDKDKYKWSDIPVGSKLIDTKTGIEWVKLEGESDWVPAHVKNDGTLCIAKDAKRIVETYMILNPDEGNGFFSCKNEDGQVRHFEKTKLGYVFNLEKGSYQKNRNQLSVIIDDVLHRSASSGGIIEITETKFILTDPLVAGQEVSILYTDVLRIGNPYPRIFISKEEPAKAEIGDLWIDEDATLGDDTDEYYETFADPKKIPWDRIVDTPVTLVDYGIKTPQYTQVGHNHVWLDITDRPKKLPADGGDSATVAGHMPGTGPDNIAVLDEEGCILPSMLPTQFLIKSGAFYVQDNKPGIAVEKSLWICTNKYDPHIEVYINHAWLRLESNHALL